jgi:hypothetical protein
MGNIFSNKSFMNRYFSAPKSTGPAQIDPMYNGEPGVQKEDFNQFSGTEQPTKMQEQEGPAKRTRAERQADRDSKKTKRRGDRADKRVKRNEAKIEKLKTKVKDGKEVFNVDEAGNKTTGRKANRIKRAEDKVEDNKKISQKSKDQKKEKGEIKAKEVKVKTKKADLLTVRQIAAAEANKAKELDKFVH